MDVLREDADPIRAPQQQAYMKSEMPFLGVTVPRCRQVARSLFKVHPLPNAREWESAILALWRNATYREERYVAVELLLFERYSTWTAPARAPMMEELVVTGAWWDYVDAIAGRGMWTMLAAHPRPANGAHQALIPGGDAETCFGPQAGACFRFGMPGMILSGRAKCPRPAAIPIPRSVFRWPTST